MIQKTILMDRDMIRRSIMRMAHEILECCADPQNLVLLGIRRGGELPAEMLQQDILKICGIQVPLALLDTRAHRDDAVPGMQLPPAFASPAPVLTGREVVLVDDVICTGRTVRAAIDALLLEGRPRVIRLAVLIDRGHRELPLKPDFIGKNVPTSHREYIEVRTLPDIGLSEAVILEQEE